MNEAPRAYKDFDVVLMHVDQTLIHYQEINAEAYCTLARIGGRNYLRFGEIVTV